MKAGPRVSRLKYRKTIAGSCTSADVLKRSPAVPWPCRSRWSDQVPLFKWLLSSFITRPPAGTLPHFDRFWNIKEKRWSVDESQLKSTFSFCSGLLRNWFYINYSGYMIKLQAGYFPQLSSAHTGSVFVSHHESRCVQASITVHQRCHSELTCRCSRDHVPTASVWTCSIMTAWIHVKINPVCSFHARLLYFTLLDSWAVPRLSRSGCVKLFGFSRTRIYQKIKIWCDMEQEEITEGQSAEDRTAAVEALHSSSTLKSRTNQTGSSWSPNWLEGEKFKYKSEFFYWTQRFSFATFFFIFYSKFKPSKQNQHQIFKLQHYFLLNRTSNFAFRSRYIFHINTF